MSLKKYESEDTSSTSPGTAQGSPMQDRDKLAHNYFFKRASELIKSSPFLSLLVKGITYRTSGAMNPRSNTAHSEGTFTGPFPGCLVRNRSDETGKEMTEVLLAGYGG